MMFDNKLTRFLKFRKEIAMRRLFNPFIADEYDGRKQRNASDHAYDNSFGHNDSQVPAECKCHKAQGGKTCNRRNGTTYN